MRVFVFAGAMFALVSVFAPAAGALPGAQLRGDGWEQRADLEPGQPLALPDGVGIHIPRDKGLGVTGIFDSEFGSVTISALLSDEGAVYTKSYLPVKAPWGRARLGGRAGRMATTTTNECVADFRNNGDSKWFSNVQFWINHSGRPSDISAAQWQQTVFDSIVDVFGVNNHCGAADNMSLVSSYSGTTVTSPNFYNSGGTTWCSEPFNTTQVGAGSSVFGWWDFPSDGYYGATCRVFNSSSYVPGTAYFSVKSADVVLARYRDWEAVGGGCSGGELFMETVLAHEVGHLVGIEHVSHNAHTMNSLGTIPACTNYGATMAKGDYMLLNSKY